MQGDSESYTIYLAAQQLMSEGKMNDALELYSKSLELDHHYKTLQRIAEIYESKKLMDLAFSFYEKAFIANPKSDVASVRYARYLIEKGEIQKASNILFATLSRNSSYLPAKKLLNTIHDNQSTDNNRHQENH